MEICRIQTIPWKSSRRKQPSSLALRTAAQSDNWGWLARSLEGFSCLKSQTFMTSASFAPGELGLADLYSAPSPFSLCCLLLGSLHFGFPEGTGLVRPHLFGALGPSSPLSKKILWWKINKMSETLSKVLPKGLDQMVSEIRISIYLVPKLVPNPSLLPLFSCGSSWAVSQTLTYSFKTKAQTANGNRSLSTGLPSSFL